MSNLSYCPCDLPAWELVACGQKPKGGVADLVFICLDHTFTDFESADEWATQVAAGKAAILSHGMGEIPAPSPVEGPTNDACLSETEIDTYDRTVKWTTNNVSAQNIELVDAINGKQGYLALRTCGDTLRVEDRAVATFMAFSVTPASKKSPQTIEVSAKWTYLNEPHFLSADGLSSIFGD